MHVQVLLCLLAASSASTANSLPENEMKGRTFLWTYPADTFPLSNRHKTVPKIAKLRSRLADNGDKTIEDAIETDLIASEEILETTENVKGYEDTSYIDINLEVTTNPVDIVTLDTVKNDKAIDDVDKSEDTQAYDLLNKDYQIKRQKSTSLRQDNSSKEEFARNEKSLINKFPFHHQKPSNPHGSHDSHDIHGGHHVSLKNIIAEDRSVLGIERATDLLDQLSSSDPDSSGRRCVDKVMMREETEYDEILTCDHSYDKRCHTSYVTKYEPHQEQECDEKFRKVCIIEYEQKAVHEMVEVCITPFVKDCDIEGEDVCQTVYESECSTVQIVHRVEDDVVNCRTEEERKCEDVTEGFKTVSKCDTWPVEKCTLEKKLVEKYTPHTSCQKVPKEMCSPKGCGVKEGPVQCQDKVKTVIVDSPIEECDMEPLRTCKHITKLVPKLEAAQDCVDVPKEICARSKVNPRRVKKPSIQKWCFTPVSAGQCQQDADCHEDTHICKDSLCVPGCNTNEDCPSGHSCSLRKCRVSAGKVLLGSFTIKTLSCTGCSQQSEGVKLVLQGERTVEFESGYPCNTSAQIPLDHQNVEDFGSGGMARFDGSLDVDQNMMGDCFKAPLNALVRGGNLTWIGQGVWTPSYICVDWQSNNYAYKCQLEKVANKEKVFQIVDCKEDYPRQKCEQGE